MFASAVLLLLSATPKLVVTPFRSVHTSEELTTFGSEHLAQAMHERGFEVITPQDVSTMLGFERQRQLLNCPADSQSSCLAELSGALGADAILSGTIARLDGVFTIEVKVLNAHDGRTLATARSEAGAERLYLAALDTVADALSVQLKGKPGEKVGGAGARLWVPVGVGVGLAGAGGALLGASVSQVSDLTRARTVNEAPLQFSVAQQQFRDATMMRTTGITLMGLGAATAVAGVILALTAPVAVVPTASNDHVGVVIAGAMP